MQPRILPGLRKDFVSACDTPNGSPLRPGLQPAATVSAHRATTSLSNTLMPRISALLLSLLLLPILLQHIIQQPVH